MDRLVDYVYAFYEYDCLDEEVILEWYSKKDAEDEDEDEDEDEENNLEAKMKLAPLINWLKTAEEAE